MSISPYRNPKYPGQSEVSKLHHGLVDVDQNVLRFEVSMNNSAEAHSESIAYAVCVKAMLTLSWSIGYCKLCIMSHLRLCM